MTCLKTHVNLQGRVLVIYLRGLSCNQSNIAGEEIVLIDDDFGMTIDMVLD